MPGCAATCCKVPDSGMRPALGWRTSPSRSSRRRSSPERDAFPEEIGHLLQVLSSQPSTRTEPGVSERPVMGNTQEKLRGRLGSRGTDEFSGLEVRQASHECLV